jgi:hypothetical protein
MHKLAGQDEIPIALTPACLLPAPAQPLAPRSLPAHAKPSGRPSPLFSLRPVLQLWNSLAPASPLDQDKRTHRATSVRTENSTAHARVLSGARSVVKVKQ